MSPSVCKHLQYNGLTANHASEYLSHVLHVQQVLDYLLADHGGIWSGLHNAQCCELTVIINDRFQNRQLQTVDGDVLGELPETEPLRILSKLQLISDNQVFFVQVLLHYECIKPQQIAAHTADFASIISEDVRLIWHRGRCIVRQ